MPSWSHLIRNLVCVGDPERIQGSSLRAGLPRHVRLRAWGQPVRVRRRARPGAGARGRGLVVVVVEAQVAGDALPDSRQRAGAALEHLHRDPLDGGGGQPALLHDVVLRERPELVQLHDLAAELLPCRLKPMDLDGARARPRLVEVPAGVAVGEVPL
eukprot:gene5576-biopygen7482